MDETLRELGELLLRSIPTIICFLVAYFGYRVIVHKPLLRVLEERRAKTQGAIEKARADIAAAETKMAEYEQRLHEAKLALFRTQETRRAKVLEARTEFMNEARRHAAARVAEARAAIEREMDSAKVGLEADAEKLAREVIATILRPAHVQTPAGGAQ